MFKRTRRSIFVLIFILPALSCSSTNMTTIQAPNNIAISKLLANPSQFLDREVVVTGLVKIQYEDVNIYPIIDGKPNRKLCLSLLIQKDEFDAYSKRFDNKRGSVRGIFTSPACPTGTICTWICNDKYGIAVEDIAP